MNKLILIVLVVVMFLVAGCSNLGECCVDGEAESIILIYEYSETHMVRECYQYCDNLCFNGNIFPGNSWTDKKCAELCKPR